VLLSENLVVEGIGNDAAKLPADVLLKELFDVHDGGVVFAAEPSATLAFLGPSKIAGVAPGRLAPRAVVLPQAILEEGLGQPDLEEATISTKRQRLGR